MTAKRFYGLALLVIILGLWAIVVFPEASLYALSISIPFAVIGGGIATGYLARVFRRQPIPRSRFFRMLIESFFALLLIGVWVGYLSLARILERAHAAGVDVIVIPSPPPAVSSPISALIVIIVFLAPIRFAAEVYRRRRVHGETTEEAADRIDRDPEQEDLASA
jgi:hypothetical protein